MDNKTNKGEKKTPDVNVDITETTEWTKIVLFICS